MPGFGAKRSGGPSALSDAQIVLVSNYVLSNFGDGHVTVSAEQVAQGRRGGPKSPLLLEARVGIGAVIVAVLVAIFFFVRRRKRRSVIG